MAYLNGQHLPFIFGDIGGGGGSTVYTIVYPENETAETKAAAASVMKQIYNRLQVGNADFSVLLYNENFNCFYPASIYSNNTNFEIFATEATIIEGSEFMIDVYAVKTADITASTVSVTFETNSGEIPEVPTNVSAFTNDSGYLTLNTLPIYDGSVI